MLSPRQELNSKRATALAHPILFATIVFASGCATGPASPPAALRGTEEAPGSTSSETEADIQDPGPDFGSVPNSAQVVQPGHFYVESAVKGTETKDGQVESSYVPMLLRVGVAEELEVRAQMDAISRVDDQSGETTGRGPLSLGIKYRLNGGGSGFMQPSTGVEAGVLLPVASAGMDSGKLEPYLSLNLDHFLNERTTLTWNVGATSPVDGNGEQFAQGFVTGALTRMVDEAVAVYIMGESRAPTSDSGSGSLANLGTGLYWFVNQRVAFFGSYHWGVNSESLDSDVAIGTSVGF